MSTKTSNSPLAPFAVCVIDDNGHVVYTVTIDPADAAFGEGWGTNMCHEHINEAVASGVENSGRWLVRLLYTDPASNCPESSKIYEALDQLLNLIYDTGAFSDKHPIVKTAIDAIAKIRGK